MRLLVLLPLFALASAACGPALGDPCSVSEPCLDVSECVLSRCRELSKPVAPREARRVVLSARRFSVISRDSDASAGGSVLAQARGGVEALIFDFDSGVSPEAEVVAAFFVIEPEPGAPGPSEALSLRVFEVNASWEAGRLSPGRAPTVGSELAALTFAPANRAPFRFDVTSWVASRRANSHGLLLRCDGADPVGARLLVEVRSSRGPRLELYLK